MMINYMAGIKGKAGRKPTLTKEVLAKIKLCILAGKSLKETAEACEIESNTIYRWSCDNYANFSDKIELWRMEYKLLKADRNIDAILDLPVTDKDFTKTVADMSKFVKETLDKKNYSKRSELTGEDGKDLQPVLVKFLTNENDRDSS